jgi:hypothetical protein
MILLLAALQTFEETRLDVPVVGRPTIGGFHQTRVDVPVIGRPTTGASFHRGWSLSTYRSRMTAPSLVRIDRREIASAAAPPAIVKSFLQSSVSIKTPAAPAVAVAPTPAAPVVDPGGGPPGGH